jgi:hypothetical protein
MAAAARLRYTSAAALAASANDKECLAMLDSLPPIVELLLSSGESVLADAVKDASLSVGNTVVTPEEPTTLALAFVGIATLAIYFIASGLRRSRRNKASATPVKFASTVRRPSDNRSKEIPKRGAA